eukprot:TRINITY_DN10335_c0_g1_i1.p1 TRINITY_DN10335_c0_g1~~TRINITY_DN10335_c0_g1_i1.p1  ORF type:complete len:458 (+),score=89.91 TRINITY_DN10335_c0_g1_i1:15-1388(+)
MTDRYHLGPLSLSTTGLLASLGALVILKLYASVVMGTKVKRDARSQFVWYSFLFVFSIINFFDGNIILAAIILSLGYLSLDNTLYNLLIHPSQIAALVSAKFNHKMPKIPDNISPSSKYCYVKLTQVSRSFSAVILSLNDELKSAICLFYLALRALDTIEDDMKPKIQDKVPHLKEFYKHLREPGWNLKGYGDKKDEIDLLEQYQHVVTEFLKLHPKYQDVIEDITHKMGDGMAEYLEKRVVTVEDYDKYCWYVAGLVGEGLSKLFSASGLESEVVGQSYNLYRSMGLFLQKTNIIRDYLEDIEDNPPRIFYPKEIWERYVDSVHDLKDPKYRNEALQCLNEMVTNALGHVPDVIDYLSLLKEPSVFTFCAIPQVMAIATLQLCYNNYEVFKKNVKISKGLAVQMILNSNSLKEVIKVFIHFVDELEKDVLELPSNQNTMATMSEISKIRLKLKQRL